MIQHQVDLVAPDVEELIPASIGIVGIPGGQLGRVEDQGPTGDEVLLGQVAHQ